jgi:PIN domain nuclease of toxin-antitoxin system
VRVVADSHAIVWFVSGSSRLSSAAADVLVEAEETDGIVVSVATLIDLWYVTQTTEAVTTHDLVRLRTMLEASSTVTLQPITLDVVDACTAIPRELLADPWDRLIVATAKALDVALVTRDRAIQKAGLLPTVW